MAYKIKEIFYTLQGEGGQTGRAAVFCRFTGCNLWTGRERRFANFAIPILLEPTV
jgi:7-carboxy-7-deazaguanine synthase